jgi:hypothetical protein
MPPGAEGPERGADRLDAALRPIERRWWGLPRRRPALGVRSIAAPTLLYVALGIALGPSGLGILTPAVLSEGQTIAWISLAVIGVFVGLGFLAVAREARGTTIASAGIVALITIGTIAGGLFIVIPQSHLPVAGVLPSSLLIGLCASVSGALLASAATSGELRRAAHLADLDDVPVVLAGTVLVATLGGDAVAVRLAATVAGGAAIGVAGWLLFEDADAAERGLYVSGAVLLLAGIGAYLGTSPLLSGCCAAIVWARLPGEADRITAQDLRSLQHPLVALLLIMAGAMTQWSAVVLWVTAYIVVLRLAAKLFAAVLIQRLASASPALLAIVLLHPGIMGIALAVNVRLILGAEFDWLVAAVTVSAVVSDVLAALLPYAHEDAA